MGRIYGKGTFESGEISFAGINGIDLKSDHVNAGFVNVLRKPILFSFSLDKPPTSRILKTPKIKDYKNLHKSLINKTTFYLENDLMQVL